MHEASIAQSLVELVEEELARSNASDRAKVQVVRVQVGELSGVVPQALQSAFLAAARAFKATRQARLVIESIAVSVWCGRCEKAVTLLSASRLVCPACAHPTPEVIAGRELALVAVELDDEPPPQNDEDPLRRPG